MHLAVTTLPHDYNRYVPCPCRATVPIANKLALSYVKGEQGVVQLSSVYNTDLNSDLKKQTEKVASKSWPDRPAVRKCP
jgi:hypothetical protein